MRRWVTGLAVMLLLLVPSGGATADLIAMSADSYDIYNNLPHLVLGETVHISQPITITALGYLDLGTGTSHDVGIYDLSGNLLAMTVVDTNTDTKIGFFRYHDLSTPFALGPGDYVLAGETGTDAYTYYSDGVFPNHVKNFAAGPGVSFSDDRFVFSSNLVSPPIQTPDPAFAYFTANFQYSIVPEPSSLVIAFVGSGLLGGYGMIQRRRGCGVSSR